MKQAAYGGLTYNVNINDTKAQSSLRTLKGAIRSTGQEWRSNASAMQAAGDSASALDAKITGLNKEIELQTDYNKRLAEALKNANATTDKEKLAVMRWTNELTRSNAALKRRQSELDSARAAEIRYSTGIDRAQKSHRAYTNAIEASEKALSAEGKEEQASAKHKELLAAKTSALKDELGREEKAFKALKSSASSSNIDINKQSAVVSKAREAYAKAREEQRKYSTGLHQMEQYSKSTAEISQSLASRLRAEGKNYTAMSVELKTLIGSRKGLLTQYKTEMSELELIKKRSGDTSAAYSAQAKKVNDLGARIGETDSKIRSLNKNVGLSGSAINSFSDKIGGMQKKYAGVANAMSAVSRGTGYATLGLAAVTKQGVSMSTSLESSFTKTKNLIVKSNTEGTSEINRNLAKMKENAKAYSKEYGLTQKQIADGYQDLIKRGYSSSQAVGAMKTLVKGAIATGDDFNDVTAVSTQTLESFGLRANTTGKMAKNTAKVVNEMAYAADMTATDFQSLGKGMEYVGNTAHQAGFSISETASAMGILSNNGLESDKAGTGLRKTINSLVSPTDNATGALKKLGLSTSSFTDKNGKMKSMSEIFGILNRHMKGLSGHDRTDVFHAIFGTTGQQAGGILTDNYKSLGKLNDEVARSAKNDYIGGLSAKNMETAQNQFNKFKVTFQALEIEFANVLLPYLTKGAKALTGLMDKFDKLSPSAKKAAGATLLLVPAISAVTGVIAAFIRNSGTIATVVSKMFSKSKIDTAGASKSAVAAIDEQTAAVKALALAWADAGEAAGAEAAEAGAGAGGGFKGKAGKTASEVESVGTREEYKAAKKSSSKTSVLKRMAKGQTTTEDAEAISSRIGKVGTTGSKLGKIARGTGGVLKRIPWLQTGLAAMNLIGINKKNAGQKVGSTAGQLGGTIGGGAIGTGLGGLIGGGLGTFFGPAGTVAGAKIGSTVGGLAGSFFGGSKGQDWGGQLGKKIQKSMKNFKMPKMSTITKSIGDWFGGIGKWIGKLKLPSINFGKMFKGFKMPNIGKMFKNFKMPKISGIGKWFSGLFKGLKMPSLSSLGKSIGSAFSKMFSGLGKTGIGKSISKMLAGVGKTMSGWAKGIGKFFAPAVKAIQAPFNKIGKWFKTSPVGKSIVTIGKDIAGVVKGIGKFIEALGAIAAKLAAIGLVKLFQGIGKAVKNMGKFFTDVGKKIKSWAKSVRKTIDNMVKPIQKTMGKIGSGISKAWSGTLKNVTKFVKAIYNTATRWIGKMLSPLAKAWQSISKTAAKWWKSISNTVGSWAHKLYKEVTKWVGNLLSPVAKAWQSISKTAARWWKSISNSIGSWVHKIYTNVTKWFRNLLSPVAKAWKNISNTIGGWIKGIWKNISKFGDNMASFFKKLPGRIAGALRGAWHGIWNSMAGIINNGVIHPVINGWNAVAGAINGVEKKIGVGKSFRLDTASYGSAKLSTYAKGTPGGPALVNDAKSKYWREAYKLPDGRMGMFPNKRNIIVNLPKGTEIAKGEDARMVQPYLEHTGGKIPAFASATGWLDGIGSAIGGAVHGVGNWFSGVETKASKLIDNLGKMIKSPAKYLSAMIASPLNALAKGGGIAAKAVGMTGDIVVNSLTSWFKKMLKAGQDEQLVGNVKLGGSVASRARALAKAFKQGYPASNNGGIAGILGNWIQESNLNPSAVNASDHGTGLGQWTFTRETGLRNWLRRHGYAWNSAAGQIGYALNEPGANGMLKAVLRMTNPTAAAQKFFATWESGGNMDASGGARLSNASAVYRYIKGMEHGGLVDKAQMINIAEHNKPEMVVSLTNKDAAIRQLKQSISYLENGNVATTVDTQNAKSADSEKLDQIAVAIQQTNALLQAILSSNNTPNVAYVASQSVVDAVEAQRLAKARYNNLIN